MSGGGGDTSTAYPGREDAACSETAYPEESELSLLKKGHMYKRQQLMMFEI